MTIDKQKMDSTVMRAPKLADRDAGGRRDWYYTEKLELECLKELPPGWER